MSGSQHDRLWRERLAGLPREVAPPRDGWDAIEKRIRAAARAQASGHASEQSLDRLRLRWPIAAAAAAVLILAVVTGLWRTTPDPLPSPTPSVSARVPARAPGYAGSLQVTEQEYRAALLEFDALTRRGGQPDTSLEASLQGGWAVLSQTEHALERALRDHPDDPYINERLVQLRTRQVELLRQIASAGMASRRRMI